MLLLSLPDGRSKAEHFYSNKCLSENLLQRLHFQGHICCNGLKHGIYSLIIIIIRIISRTRAKPVLCANDMTPDITLTLRKSIPVLFSDFPIFCSRLCCSWGSGSTTPVKNSFDLNTCICREIRSPENNRPSVTYERSQMLRVDCHIILRIK